MAKTSKPSGGFDLRLHYRGRTDDDQQPTAALYLMGPRGRPEKKIATAEEGVLRVPGTLDDEAVVALGPDADDPEALSQEVLLQYRAAEALPRWREAGLIELPRQRWTLWTPIYLCVSGQARKCFFPPLPTIPPIISAGAPTATPINVPGPLLSVQRRSLEQASAAFRQPVLPLTPLFRCEPLCGGRVEIYERVCCCDPWVLVPRIPELIPEIPELIPIPLPDPPFPDPPIPRPEPPLPDPPGPGPFRRARRLDPEQSFERTQKAYEASVEPARQIQMEPRVSSDLRTLRNLPTQEAQAAFLEARPYLVAILCRRTCTTKNVGETTLGVDGRFTFCYLPSVIGSRCTRTFAYRVKQWIGGMWVTVYDGLAASAFFSASEDPTLTTYHPQAVTCSVPEPPVPGHGDPFVMLQAIGSTDTHRLHSPQQNAAEGLNVGGGLDSNAGLIDQSYASDCPLAQTLKLLLYIDPGMQSVGARYYRFSLARANVSGNPLGGWQILDGGVTWRRFKPGTFPPEVEAVALGPDVVGGEAGLNRIPYVSPTSRWLAGQYHYAIDTTTLTNGRWLLRLELFDSSGDRIKPSGAAGAGTAAGFHYLYWDTPTTTDTVPFASLVHVLHIDNLPTYADIVDLRRNGVANTAECQFMTGRASTTFSAGFRAFQANGFLHSYRLRYKRGLNGSWTPLEIGNANQPASLLSGSPAVSASETFGTMLGSEPKCTFALELKTEAKHTNGSSRIQGYDREDTASFALEVVPPAP